MLLLMLLQLQRAIFKLISCKIVNKSKLWKIDSDMKKVMIATHNVVILSSKKNVCVCQNAQLHPWSKEIKEFFETYFHVFVWVPGCNFVFQASEPQLL